MIYGLFVFRTGMREQREKLLGNRNEIRNGGNQNFADLGTTSWTVDDDDDDEPLSSQPLLQSEFSARDLKSHQQRMVEGKLN